VAGSPVSFIGVIAPALVTFQITEDGGGAHAFSWPSNVTGGAPIDTTANHSTSQTFIWNGTTIMPVGSGFTSAGNTVFAGSVSPILTSGVNNAILVDGCAGANTPKYACSPAGIQAAIDQANANGGGVVKLPPTNGTPIAMGSTQLQMRSFVTLEGAGIGATVLQWTGGPIAIGLTSPMKATIRDLTMQFTSGAANNSGIRITTTDAAPALFNSFENLLFDFPCTGGACGFGGTPGLSLTGVAFFITSTGPSNTDFVLNTIRNVYVSAADEAVNCQGCEGNYWQVIAQYMGGTSGHAIFFWTGLEADEQGDLRAETGTGNPATLSCLNVSGSTNDFRLTCDGGGSTITAIGADPGWNKFDIVTAGPVTLGSPSANSQYRFNSSSSGTNSMAVGTLARGIGNDGSGYKHKRFGATTATAATIGSTQTTTFSWTTAFADANYTPVCIGVGPTQGGILSINSFNASGVTVIVFATTNAAASFSGVDCVAVHD
jgi:hypothetical protein